MLGREWPSGNRIVKSRLPSTSWSISERGLGAEVCCSIGIESIFIVFGKEHAQFSRGDVAALPDYYNDSVNDTRTRKGW
jgi:hypothetical protein